MERSRKIDIPEDTSRTVQAAVEFLAGIAELLIVKNRAYGDSAANPMRIFSQASPIEQILVRIDDKLSRISKGAGLAAGAGDGAGDVVRDLVGYLALLAALLASATATKK